MDYFVQLSLMDFIQEDASEKELNGWFISFELIRMINERNWALVQKSLDDFQKRNEFASAVQIPQISSRERRLARKTMRKSIPLNKELIQALDSTYIGILCSTKGRNPESSKQSSINIQNFIFLKTKFMFVVLDIISESLSASGKDKFPFSVSLFSSNEETIAKFRNWSEISAGCKAENIQEADREAGRSDVNTKVDLIAPNRKRKKPMKGTFTSVEQKNAFLNRFEELCAIYNQTSRNDCLSAVFMASGNIILAGKILEAGMDLNKIPKAIRSRVFSKEEDKILIEQSKNLDVASAQLNTPKEILERRLAFLLYKCSLK